MQTAAIIASQMAEVHGRTIESGGFMVIECVPNVSEGRRPEIVAAMADAIRGVAGVRLLDYSSDASHNRSVLTLAGDAQGVERAVLALF